MTSVMLSNDNLHKQIQKIMIADAPSKTCKSIQYLLKGDKHENKI